MEEAKLPVLKFGMKDKMLNLAVDSNKDGEPVLKIGLNISEAIQEAFMRNKAIEGAKLVEMKFEGSKLRIMIDTDKDGEKLLELEINMLEAVDEIKDITFK